MPIAQSSSSKHQVNSTKTLAKKSESEQEQVASNAGTKTPPEQPEFIKQTLIIIEKKVRNLDKRRQKLDEYKHSQKKGQTLNEDQLLAVSKYDEVIRTLELSRELEKQFITLANDTMKQQKKQAKKDLMEREEQLKEKLKETHKYFSLLEKFADETVRNDFLNEAKGAIKITQQELDLLDDFDKLLAPCSPGAKLESASSEFAEHLAYLIEGKNKPVATLATVITYSDMKKLFEKLINAEYWTEIVKPVEPEVVPEIETPLEVETPVVDSQEQVEALQTAVDGLQLQNEMPQGEQVYQNQSEEYVIVSSSECAESLCHSKSPSLQPQQTPQQQENVPQDFNGQTQQPKTFFTTLNQPEQQRNINEFINSCENSNEGINFFQDSELSSRQQQEKLNQEQNEMNFQNQQGQGNNYNQEQNQNDIQKDQHYKNQRGGHPNQQNGNNRNYNQNRNNRYQNDDRRGGNNMNNGPRNNGPRQGNGQYQGNDNEGGYRGPRQNNNGYRGGANSGPRGDANGQRGGGYRGQNGNGPRGGNAQRGNYQNQQHSQMA